MALQVGARGVPGSYPTVNVTLLPVRKYPRNCVLLGEVERGHMCICIDTHKQRLSSYHLPPRLAP